MQIILLSTPVLVPLLLSLIITRLALASRASRARIKLLEKEESSQERLVHVVGRLYPGQSTSDRLGELGHGEITSINPSSQASRLGTPVYQAYLALDSDAPGISSLTPLPS